MTSRQIYHCCFVSVFVFFLGTLWHTANVTAGETKIQNQEKAEKKAELDPEEPSKPTKVVVFRLQGSLSDSPAGDTSLLGLFSGGSSNSLLKLTQRMRRTATDPEVASVALVLEGFSCGSAQVEEIHEALKTVKKAGKEIHAYAESFSMRSFYLASVATRISVVPTGDVSIMGLYGESMYLRGLFDLVGVEPDFLTCGDYKSAAETYMRHGPSKPAKENDEWLMDSMYTVMLDRISQGRKVTPEKVKAWIDEGMYSAEQAKAAGIIDAVEFRQDFSDQLLKSVGKGAKLDLKYGLKEEKPIDFSSPFALLKLFSEALNPKSETSKKPAIAVVHIEGSISLGDSGSGGFPFGTGPTVYSTPIRKVLEKVAADDSIKAVVLRVNSPGGSAVASEIMLDATRRVKAKKPLVVSMGNVAASGGYYVACAADTVFADRSTITGSIGVVSGKLATHQVWRRFGINWDSSSRGARAGLLSSYKPFSVEEKAQLQKAMNEIYGVFKGHVLASRKDRLKHDLDSLAGGRVFSGEQALDSGLIDRIGTLHDAIKYAEQLGKVEPDKYELREYPQSGSFLESLLSDGTDDDDSLQINGPAKRASLWTSVFQSHPQVQPLLTALRQTDPQRFQAVMQAFQQLDLLQRERLLLVTPPFVVW